MALRVQQKARTQVDDFETRNLLRLFVEVNQNIIRLQICVHDAQLGEQTQGFTHSEDEVPQKIKVVSQRMIEVSVVNHIDTLAFVKLTFNFEKVFVHRATRTQLVHQPKIFFILYAIEQHTNVLLL